MVLTGPLERISAQMPAIRLHGKALCERLSRNGQSIFTVRLLRCAKNLPGYEQSRQKQQPIMRSFIRSPVQVLAIKLVNDSLLARPWLCL